MGGGLMFSKVEHVLTKLLLQMSRLPNAVIQRLLQRWLG